MTKEPESLRAIRVRLVQELNEAEADIEIAQGRIDAAAAEYDDVLQKIKSEQGTARSLRDDALQRYNDRAQRLRDICLEHG